MGATLSGPTKAALQADTAPPAPVRPAHRNPVVGNQALLRRLQARLTIGAVDDPLEHEADAVAEQVMRAPDPASGPVDARLSRKCETCGGEIQTKCATCDAEEKVQTKREDDHDSVDEAPAAVDEALRQPGRPLDAPTQALFESKLDADLSGVRVHTGLAADKSARSVGAVGYTVGQDVVFAEGRYAPGSQDGKRLLAHELAHVVQQGGGAKPKVRRQDDPAAQGAAPDPAPGAAPSQDDASKAMGAPAGLDFEPEDGAGDANAPAADGAMIQRQADATLRRQTGQTGSGGGAAAARTLAWSDYAPSPTKQGGFSAFTNMHAAFRAAGTNFRVTFNPTGSWSYVPDQTPSLLRHEQYHLNLSVLIATKANAAAAAGTLTGAALIAAFRTANRTHQDSYDGDTNHGLDARMQTAWENDIDAGVPEFPITPPATH